jgi:hypothetical protein
VASQPLAPQVASVVEHDALQQLPVPLMPQMLDRHWSFAVQAAPPARPLVVVPPVVVPPVVVPPVVVVPPPVEVPVPFTLTGELVHPSTPKRAKKHDHFAT